MSRKLNEEADRLEKITAELESLKKKEQDGTITDDERARLARVRKSADFEMYAMAGGGAAMLVIMLIAAIWLFSGEDEAPEASDAPKTYTEADRQRQAAYACRESIKNRLVAPSTAEFPISGRQSVNTGDDLYSVRGFVDAENSFGAMLRKPYSCRVQLIGENWYTLSATVGSG